VGETRLEEALRARLDARGRAFVPYVTAGVEGVNAALLRELEDAGADALEVGLPFSDPVMDGGVIQEASQRALAGGFRILDAFALVREAELSIPVVMMTYFNVVLAAGLDRFLEDAREAGVAGSIIPDLPADEGADWTALCGRAGLAPVYLAAPDTPPERLGLIAEASEGFVYCVSTYGVTGERGSLSEGSRGLVEALRRLTSKPLLVGVGISTPAQAAEAAAFADGVIVGSALMKHLNEADAQGAVAEARAFREAVAT
jgi:tryptophan synthase alpha chain